MKNGEATRYLVGHFSDFASAETARWRVGEYGLNAAITVAYKNGQAISIEDAKALTGNR